MMTAGLKSRSQLGIPMATLFYDGRNHTERVSADGTEECLSAFWGIAFLYKKYPLDSLWLSISMSEIM